MCNKEVVIKFKARLVKRWTNENQQKTYTIFALI